MNGSGYNCRGVRGCGAGPPAPPTQAQAGSSSPPRQRYDGKVSACCRSALRGRVLFAVPPEELAGGGKLKGLISPSKAAVFLPTSCKHNTSLRHRADCRFNGVKPKVDGGELRLSVFDELVCFSFTWEGQNKLIGKLRD